jgi:hypothetical protein
MILETNASAVAIPVLFRRCEVGSAFERPRVIGGLTKNQTNDPAMRTSEITEKATRMDQRQLVRQSNSSTPIQAVQNIVSVRFGFLMTWMRIEAPTPATAEMQRISMCLELTGADSHQLGVSKW